MDNQDKEFETFLQRFQLRKHRPLVEPTLVVRAKWSPNRWVFAAVAAVVLALLSIPLVRTLSISRAPVAVVERPGDSTYRAGQTITAGEPIRSGGFDGLVFSLEDGTRVEMRAQSELQMESVADGIMLRLKNGSIVVEAAEQPDGHLYVEARDLMISVVGTVFFVESELSGARVAVLEGEVEVRQKTSLGAGQQSSYSPQGPLQPLSTATAWSSRAAEFGALQPPATPVAPVQQSASSVVKIHVQQPQPTAAAPAPAPQAPPPPPPQTDAGGDGAARQTFNRACGACHSTDFVKPGFPSRDAVATLVNRERMKGAQVSQEETPSLIDFIFRVYGVTTRASGQEVFERTCLSCHGLDVAGSRRYESREAAAARIAVDLSYLGNSVRLSDAEIASLVDYVFRTYGRPLQ